PGSPLSCACHSASCETLLEGASFLGPFNVEFVVFCSVMLFVMWRNVGRDPSASHHHHNNHHNHRHNHRHNHDHRQLRRHHQDRTSHLEALRNQRRQLQRHQNHEHRDLSHGNHGEHDQNHQNHDHNHQNHGHRDRSHENHDEHVQNHQSHGHNHQSHGHHHHQHHKLKFRTNGGLAGPVLGSVSLAACCVAFVTFRARPLTQWALAAYWTFCAAILGLATIASLLGLAAARLAASVSSRSSASSSALWLMTAFNERPLRVFGYYGAACYGRSTWLLLLKLALPLGVFYRMHSVASLLEVYGHG
ncbi:unnamed protein product, partial [Lampetra fluviatilis]